MVDRENVLYKGKKNSKQNNKLTKVLIGVLLVKDIYVKEMKVLDT